MLIAVTKTELLVFVLRFSALHLQCSLARVASRNAVCSLARCRFMNVNLSVSRFICDDRSLALLSHSVCSSSRQLSFLDEILISNIAIQLAILLIMQSIM
jgi:hypothetical protein